MARDLALLDRARLTGECTFSIYSWSRPTLSFGRNQTVRGHYSRELVAAAGMDVVRRPTGGRSILHNREATYSAAAPDSFAPSLREGYEKINAIVIEGLRALGANAVAATNERAARPGPAACFSAPSAGELIAGGRKIVGSAQWRDDGAFLQHGSILIEDDQHDIAKVMIDPDPAHLEVATLGEIMGRTPSVSEIAEHMFSAIRNMMDPGARFLERESFRSSTDAYLGQFTNPEWTWRR